MSNGRQAASAIGGAVIGYFVGGGAAGALRGFQLGLLAGSTLFPADLPSVTGPRLADFEKIEADPGAVIPLGWGNFPVSGFRMYLGPRLEVPNTQTHGGKGSPEQQVTEFEYFQTLGLGLHDGEIDNVLRIWENGELKYDVREQFDDESFEDYQARLAMSAEYELGFVLYYGTEDQLPDPTLESELGVGNVPAFRGLAWIIFPERRLLPEQGNRHPNFKIHCFRQVD